MDPHCAGSDLVYEVYTDINESGWVNKTIIYPGRLGNEYPKTFGHYHSTNEMEVYKVIKGEGFLLKQNDQEAVLVKLSPGVQYRITSQWGHCLINTGQTDLVVLDNWSWGHKDSDYDPIKNAHGMAYYLIEDKGFPKSVMNPHYQNQLALKVG